MKNVPYEQFVNTNNRTSLSQLERSQRNPQKSFERVNVYLICLW